MRSRKFREALEDALVRYTNKAITTAEMIARLIDLARDLREAQRQGEALGLSTEEIAFYDALADNASAREVMRSDTLRLMARELTEMVRGLPKLDWTQRESVRQPMPDERARSGRSDEPTGLAATMVGSTDRQRLSERWRPGSRR